MPMPRQVTNTMGIHTASAQHVSGALKKQYQALLLGWDAHKESAAAPPAAKEGAPPPATVAAADGAPRAPRVTSEAAAEAAAVVEPGPQPEAEAEAEVEATPPQAAALEEGAVAQPAKGSVSRAKGKVCWRFAGHLCYGSLLPAQESKTHCYARTHKGNTKVLTKGGASWWMET